MRWEWNGRSRGSSAWIASGPSLEALLPVRRRGAPAPGAARRARASFSAKKNSNLSRSRRRERLVPELAAAVARRRPRRRAAARARRSRRSRRSGSRCCGSRRRRGAGPGAIIQTGSGPSVEAGERRRSRRAASSVRRTPSGVVEVELLGGRQARAAARSRPGCAATRSISSSDERAVAAAEQRERHQRDRRDRRRLVDADAHLEGELLEREALARRGRGSAVGSGGAERLRAARSARRSAGGCRRSGCRGARITRRNQPKLSRSFAAPRCSAA